MAESPVYKLLYYPFRGRAELLRLIFVYLDIPFEDVRISPEEWAKLKPDSPFGVIPIVEFVEKKKRISGSATLARYFAEEHGFSGSSSLEKLELFSIVDATADAWVQIYQAIYHEKDKERKAILVKKLHEDYLPDHIYKFERRAFSNGANEGFIFGDKLTYADLAVYLLFDYAMSVLPEAKLKYPTLAKLKESVEGIDRIAAWLKARPVTTI